MSRFRVADFHGRVVQRADVTITSNETGSTSTGLMPGDRVYNVAGECVYIEPLCWTAVVGGGCPSFCRCEACPL